MLETVEAVFDRISGYAVQVIMPHFHPDGSIDIAVMPYTKGYGTTKQFTTLRLPTETGKPFETVLETTLRGLREEAAEDYSAFGVEIWGIAHAALVPDQKDPSKHHVKIAMVAEHKSGELRKHPKPDEDDQDEFHGAMRWVEARKLLTQRIEGHKVLFPHGSSICAFLSALAHRPEFKEVAQTYYSVIGEFPHKPLTPTEWEAVQTYAGLK